MIRKEVFMLFLLLVIAMPLVHGALPSTMSIQGKLINSSNGEKIDSKVQFVFKIYATHTGGVALWQETQNVNVDDGYYIANLGIVNPIDLDFDIPYFLGISIAGDSEMSPRINLTSTPYSFRSEESEGLSCVDCIDDSQLNYSNITLGDLTNDVGYITMPQVNGSSQNASNFFGYVWTNIVGRLFDAIDNLYLSVVGGTLTFNESKLNATINFLDDDTLASLGCSDEQIPKWNQSSAQWYCSEDYMANETTADIDSVQTPGNYLTGGGLSGDIILSVDEIQLNATIDARAALSDTDTWNTTEDMRDAINESGYYNITSNSLSHKSVSGYVLYVNDQGTVVVEI